MTDVTLVNYRGGGVPRLMSITRLPEAEAAALAAKLYEENPNSGYRRFGPAFMEYYKLRRDVEKRLYERFCAIGGKPATEHPLYFFVQEWNIDDVRLWEDKITDRIRLSEIHKDDISFTCGDSMDGADKHEGLFGKDKLIELLGRFGGDADRLLDSVERRIGHRVIEAQIWNDKYFT